MVNNEVCINIQNKIPYPFFDNACISYEALRTVYADGKYIQMSLQKYGLTEYAYQKRYAAFQKHGVTGLIGDDSKQYRLIDGKRIAFDFNMLDFTGDDIKLKNIGKGPSPKRKICFPGFRPHIAWDVDTGAPITIEFRNGKARATTTVKRFILELLQQSIGKQGNETGSPGNRCRIRNIITGCRAIPPEAIYLLKIQADK